MEWLGEFIWIEQNKSHRKCGWILLYKQDGTAMHHVDP